MFFMMAVLREGVFPLKINKEDHFRNLGVGHDMVSLPFSGCRVWLASVNN